ncbi:hypothetical protein D3C87_1296390 [compost metagenome]
MHQLQFCRKMFINIYPGPAKKMKLFIKLRKTGPPLMVNLCGRDQANLKSLFVYPDAVLNVFAQAGQYKAANLFPNLT